jgi:phosphoglucomutase
VIKRWRDLTTGYDSDTADNKPLLPIDASAQMITCELEDVVFTARGSGTEPKIKLYVEAQGPSSEQATAKAGEVVSDLLREWCVLPRVEYYYAVCANIPSYKIRFRPEYNLKLAGS